jgi:AcrR family transcriptional regulator
MKKEPRRGPTGDGRERIIAAAATLFHDQGYAATGLDNILQAAGATKGSFHHHFGSKREIALAVVDEVVTRQFTRRMIDPVANAAKPLDAIRKVLRDLRMQVAPADLLSGCPINNLASELALRDRVIQKTLSGLFEKWQTVWAEALKRDPLFAKVAGRQSPRHFSMYLVAVIEGAQAMAKAQQSREPLDAALKQLEALLEVR